MTATAAGRGELLVEFRSEEIPARFQAAAARDLATTARQALDAAGLGATAVESFVTCRRLTLVCQGVPLRQPDRHEDRRGPRAGAPERAVQGFLKSVGLARQACDVRQVRGIDYLFARIEKPGQPAAAVLPAIVAALPDGVAWPVSMRWASGRRRWVRPMQGVVAVFAGQPLKGMLAADPPHVFSAETRGHPFLGSGLFTVRDFAGYEAGLAAACVVLRPAARRARIRAGLEEQAARRRVTVSEDAGLLTEVVGLTEWPVVLGGAIDPAFMSLPDEVLTASMRNHQRYFATREADGRLAPHFLFVADMETDDGGAAIVAGNERVLRARLADAAYFRELDRKRTLADRIGGLDKVVFHARLGSLGDKMRRVRDLAGWLAHRIDGADPALAARAAMLAKADLLTEMVGAFPELQGCIGGHYAREQGEDARVAAAVASHYAPAGPGDDCPSAPVSVALGLADRLDSLAGFWHIATPPTGSRDPYALRRAALGVVRLILENGLQLPLRAAIGQALAPFGMAESGGAAASGDSPAVIAGRLHHFIADRLKVSLKESGVAPEYVEAVFALDDEDDLGRLAARTRALADFVATGDGHDFLAVYRRAANILRAGPGDRATGPLPPQAGAPAAETGLHRAVARIGARMPDLLAAGHFTEAMALLGGLREPLDLFFTTVTVNDRDPDTRASRLALLHAIRDIMHRIADVSRLPGGQAPRPDHRLSGEPEQPVPG